MSLRRWENTDPQSWSGYRLQSEGIRITHYVLFRALEQRVLSSVWVLRCHGSAHAMEAVLGIAGICECLRHMERQWYLWECPLYPSHDVWDQVPSQSSLRCIVLQRVHHRFGWLGGDWFFCLGLPYVASQTDQLSLNTKQMRHVNPFLLVSLTASVLQWVSFIGLGWTSVYIGAIHNEVNQILQCLSRPGHSGYRKVCEAN